MRNSEVIARLDRMFAPDIRIRLNDRSLVIGFEVLTPTGADFIMRHDPIFEQDYDQVLAGANGITFEIVD